MKWQINFAYYNTLYIPACVTDSYELRIYKWLGISFTTVSRNILKMNLIYTVVNQITVTILFTCVDPIYS
jgi:hypothetical protein